LLAHIAALERWLRVFTFEGKIMTEEELERIKSAMKFGEHERDKIKGNEQGIK